MEFQRFGTCWVFENVGHTERHTQTHTAKDDLGSFDIQNDLQAKRSRQENVLL